ncbi:hypothetical protein IU470_27665 [Nocardia abscessus]|uniref:Uncharacterized protein n=1 Tax=Nocardia abscessus TaxID=120957 RepID=A0ABS0CH91_9NOCA|nr:hypothetical protein [Nocardia abscessus]MBF6228858.1 hypothetical protein [Nocardia abscessus]
MWSREHTAAVVAALVEDEPGARVRDAALGLVHAAEGGKIERAALAGVFGAGEIDDAYLQLTMAGVAAGE